MNGFNRVFIMGYLGNNPETARAKNGRSFVRLNIATHYAKKSENGVWSDTTNWHQIMVWGKNAEKCQVRLHKGQALAVEGYLSSYKYEREDGKEATATSIVAREIHFIDKQTATVGPEPDVASS